LLAAQIIGLGDPALAAAVEAWRAQRTAEVEEEPSDGA
jgi:phosphoribosylcarboxyaminoimidazole (NCAIR) mutase